MQFNNGKCFLSHHYQNKKDRNPRSMQEQSRGCRFRFPPCLYIIPRVETQVLPSRVHARAINDGTLTTRYTAARTRGNDGRTISLPVPQTKHIRKTPFYWGSMIWNSLPLDMRETPSKNVFKICINGALRDNTIHLISPQ